jgi:uncharacterized protein YjdB
MPKARVRAWDNWSRTPLAKNNSAGIGGGNNASGGTVTVNGGTVAVREPLSVKAGDNAAGAQLVPVTDFNKDHNTYPYAKTFAAPVDSVTVSPTSVTLKVCEKTTLTVTVNPDSAYDKTVTWSSSNEDVAVVEQSGRVIAVGAGTATITAMSGGKSDTCTVTVEAAPEPTPAPTASTNPSVSAHVQRLGWMAWATNGEYAGTQGMSRRVEAVQVALVKKGEAAPGTTYKGVTQSYTKAFAKK